MLAFAIALTLAGNPREAGAAFPGANGRIAYVSDRETFDPDLAALYTIDPDGSGRLLVASGGVNAPAWSADGAMIAFARAGDLFVINADGSGEANVTSSPGSFESEPAWSPDGTTLAFRRANELFSVGADGTNELQLTDYPDFFNTSDSQPAWSPDGQKIVFASTRDDQTLFRSELYVMNADGTAETRLTNSAGQNDLAPNWSPDGTRIAWAHQPDPGPDQTDIFVMNANGSAQTVVTSTEDVDTDPAWSPDGSMIVFQSGSLLWTVNPDGTGLAPLTSGAVPTETSDREPDWAPGRSVPVRTLTVGKDGDGSGTVTSAPAGVSCGTDCAEAYADGTSVTLTATPDSDSELTAWSNCDEVTGVECTVAMTGDRGITATFSSSAEPPTAPTVTGLSPSNGTTAGGTSVIIAGTGFEGATAVSFGGTASSFAVDSPTQISVVAPAHDAGTVDVIVTTPAGASANTSADNYTFVTPPPPACRITGTPGPDTLTGTSGDDTICGLGGNDTLLGRGGNDTLHGGAGDDVLDGGVGADELLGETGIDTVSYASAGSSDVVADLDGAADDGPAGLKDRIATDVENIVGGGGNDALTGSSGANALTGGRGGDTLVGGEGADTLAGGDGFDTVSYSTREERVVVSTRVAGGDGASGEGDDVAADVERLVGGNGNDVLTTGAGHQILIGNPGNDVLLGGADQDELRGGDGSDLLFAEAGDDRLHGEDGDDVLEGGSGPDDFSGGAGRDTVTYALRSGSVSVSLDGDANDGGAGERDRVRDDVERLVGGQGDDVLVGAFSGDDDLLGLGGDDELRGGVGDDLLDGGAGNDELHGDEAPNQGGSGDDHLIGGPGDDLLDGDGGDDVLDGGTGGDLLHGGGSGIDTVSYAARTRGVRVSQDGVANDGEPGERDDVRRVSSVVGSPFDDVLEGASTRGTLSGGAGHDTLIGSDEFAIQSETLLGGPGNDALRGRGGPDVLYGEAGRDDVEGGAGSDRLSGGDGNDELFGGPDDDFLDGGTGSDTLHGGAESTSSGDIIGYEGRSETLNLSLDGERNDGGPGELDTILNAETVIGGNGNDTIAGDSDANRLHGGSGNDTLSGHQGSDILFGGPGNDVMRGGSGSDRFLGNEGIDTVSYAGRNDRVSADADGLLTDAGAVNLNDLTGRDDDGESGEDDTIRNDVEDIVGGNRGDTLTGNGLPNRLFGGPGNDTLRGDAADALDGGSGTDSCIGGGVRTSCESG